MGNNRCLLWELYGSLKQALWAECKSSEKLDMVAHTASTRLYSIILERRKKIGKILKIVSRNKFSPSTPVLSNNAANKVGHPWRWTRRTKLVGKVKYTVIYKCIPCCLHYWVRGQSFSWTASTHKPFEFKENCYQIPQEAQGIINKSEHFGHSFITGC